MSELKFEIKENSDLQESTEDLILKQGLRDLNHNILLESGSHFGIVATDNSTVVPRLIIERCIDTFYIKTLWVKDDYRQSGIASKLMEMLAEKTMSDEIHKIFTDTYGFQAQGFYEKQGLKVISTVPNYLLGHDKIYLKNELQ